MPETIREQGFQLDFDLRRRESQGPESSVHMSCVGTKAFGGVQ